MKKITLVFLAFLITLSVVFAEQTIIIQQESIHAQESDEIYEKKSYCTATLEDNFIDNRIIVTLKQNHSGINKALDIKAFEEASTKAFEKLSAEKRQP